MVSTFPRAEGWRIWASFFLGGLYGVIAGRYLAAREEWTVGLTERQWPPIPPSQRGVVVLGLSLFLPLLLLAVLGLISGAMDVLWISVAPGEGLWRHTRAVHVATWLNLPVAIWPVLAAVLSQDVEARIQGVLAELGGEDPQVLQRFAEGASSRRWAFVAALVPLLSWVGLALVLLFVRWHPVAYWLILTYVVSTIIALWSVSWLNISPVLRMRSVLLQGAH